MFEIVIPCIHTSPFDNRSIHLRSISLLMFIYSDPESDIHPILLWCIESNTPNQSTSNSLEYEVLKYFPILDGCFLYLDELEFLLLCWEEWTHIEILICQAKFYCKFVDIYSSISGKWNKYTSLGFYTRSREIEMRIDEKSHRATGA